MLTDAVFPLHYFFFLNQFQIVTNDITRQRLLQVFASDVWTERDPVQHVMSLREKQDLKKLNFTSCVVITGQYTDFNKQRTWCYVAHSQLGLAPPLKTNCKVDGAETVLSYLHTLFTTHCNCKYMLKYFTSQLRKPSALVRYGTHKQTHKAEMCL